MNLNDWVKAIIEFAQTPLGWAVAGLLAIFGAVLIRWLKLTAKDFTVLEQAVKNLLGAPGLLGSESLAAASGTRKKYTDVRDYLETVATGKKATKTEKIIAAAKILLK